MLKTLFGYYGAWLIEWGMLVAVGVGLSAALTFVNAWEVLTVALLVTISVVLGGVVLALPMYVYLAFKWRRLVRELSEERATSRQRR